MEEWELRERKEVKRRMGRERGLEKRSRKEEMETGRCQSVGEWKVRELGRGREMQEMREARFEGQMERGSNG